MHSDKPTINNSTSEPTLSDRPYWPFWYIRGEIYDLLPWLEEHPGGQEFILRTQGTDATAAFETHHLRMPKALAMLTQFKVETPCPDSQWPQFDWGNYNELQRRVAKRLRKLNWQPGPALLSRRVAVAAILLNLAIIFLWPQAGALTGLLAVVYATNMIIIAGFGHMFLHMNTRWQILGDMTGFSSHEWKTSHCLQHHLYPNDTEHDPDLKKLLPLLDFDPAQKTRWQRFTPFFIVPLYAIAFMMIRLAIPFDIYRDRENWQQRLALYLFGSFIWLALWALAGHFWVGLALECVASFIFLSWTLSTHNHAECHSHAPSRDYVQYQLDASKDFGSTNYWTSMVFGAFLGSQSLHHLFPTLDPSYYPVIEEELAAMGYHRERHRFLPLFFQHIRFITR